MWKLFPGLISLGLTKTQERSCPMATSLFLWTDLLSRSRVRSEPVLVIAIQVIDGSMKGLIDDQRISMRTDHARFGCRTQIEVSPRDRVTVCRRTRG